MRRPRGRSSTAARRLPARHRGRASQHGPAHRTGSIRWTGLALDGRVSRTAGRLRTYQEAGAGAGLLDAPVSTVDAAGAAHRGQRKSGSPFVQWAGGWLTVPATGPAFMMEVVAATGWGAERAASIELHAGIAF